MKRLSILILGGALAVPLVLGCGACGEPTSAPPAATAVATQTATLAIQGMTCAACSVTVRTAAKKLDGLSSIEVDVAGGGATVTFDPTKLSAQQIATKISSTGYKTTVQSDQGA